MGILSKDDLDRYVDMYFDYLDAMPPEELQAHIEAGLEETKEKWTEVAYTPNQLIFRSEPLRLSSYTAEYMLSNDPVSEHSTVPAA